eukprot:m.130671 g.130671  ORF g.130671 m.130671 type:complete len:1329 (-) comp16798_c1_seq4:908-4894(-)
MMAAGPPSDPLAVALVIAALLLSPVCVAAGNDDLKSRLGDDIDHQDAARADVSRSRVVGALPAQPTVPSDLLHDPDDNTASGVVYNPAPWPLSPLTPMPSPRVSSAVNEVDLVAPVAPLPEGRALHAAAVLHGYFVLFGGGGNNKTLNDLWTFNVTAKLWTQQYATSVKAVERPGPRLLHTLTEAHVESTEVLVLFGGFATWGNNGPERSLKLKPPLFTKPQSDTWVLQWTGMQFIQIADADQATRPPARGGHTTGFLKPYLVMFGGAKELTTLGDTWVLPLTSVGSDMNWNELKLNPSPQARMGHMLAVATETQLLVTGGCSAVAHSLCSGIMFEDAWMFTLAADVEQSTWQRLQPVESYSPFVPANLSIGRMMSGLATFPDKASLGAVQYILVSGTDGSGRWLSETLTLNMKTALWQTYPVNGPYPTPRLGLTANYVPELRGLLIFGGYSSAIELHNDLWFVEDADCGGHQWHGLGVSTEPTARRHAAMDSANGSVYLFGGYDSHVPAFSDTWRYDPKVNKWQMLPTDAATSPSGRFGHVLLSTDNGKELIMFGGIGPDVAGNLPTANPVDFWRFEIASSRWSRIAVQGDMPLARIDFAGGIRGDKLVIFGGKNMTDMMNSSWVYTFSTSTWSRVDVCPPARFAHAGSVVNSGKESFFLIQGGSADWFSRVMIDDAWAFSFKNQTWFPLELAEGSESPGKRMFHASSTFGDWAMVIYGGMRNRELLADTWFGRIRSDGRLGWSQVETTRSQHLAQHAFVILPNTTTSFLFGGRTLVDTSDLLFRLDLGCEPGWSSPDAVRVPCAPCLPGSYAATAGQKECKPCTGRTTTMAAGSTDPSECNICVNGTCSNGGKCRVDTHDSTWQCSCTFWYTGATCTVPWFLIACSGVGALIALFLIVFAACRRVKRRFRKYRLVQSEHESEIEQKDREIRALNKAWEIMADQLTMIRRIDTNWEGSFGEVWLAEWHGREVAVKKPRHFILQMDPEAVAEFEAEIRIMRELRHANVVYFYGAGSWLREPFLVTEFLANGSLAAILQDHSIELSYRRRVNFLLNAAHGMRYLHEHDPPVLHRDLKTGNLFVSEDWTVKVGDFGYGRLFESSDKRMSNDPDAWSIVSGPDEVRPRSGSFQDSALATSLPSRHFSDGALGTATQDDGISGSDDQGYLLGNSNTSQAAAAGGGSPMRLSVSNAAASQAAKRDLYRSLRFDTAVPESPSSRKNDSSKLFQYTGMVGTPAYMAPELLDHNQYGLAVDVYSFGICCWEVYTRDTPYTSITNKWRLIEQVLGGLRPTIPVDCPLELVTLMRLCWANEPQNRPTFAGVVDRLGLL